jgi:hypothetical protein
MVSLGRAKGAWGYIAAAGIGLLLLGASPVAPAPNGQAARACAQTYSKCAAPKQEPPEGFWQRSATDPVAAYTGVLAVLTGILAVVAVVQIRFLIKADKLAARSANTAEKAMISSQRAYLFAEGYKSYFEDPPDGNLERGYGWRFRPIWRNSGDTPPKNLVIYSQCEIRGGPLPDKYGFPFEMSESGTGVMSAKGNTQGGQAPRQYPDTPSSAVSPDDILHAYAGRKRIFLWGWARYDDVFEGTKRHVTHFCYQVTPVGDPLSREIGALRWDYVQDAQGNYFGDEG